MFLEWDIPDLSIFISTIVWGTLLNSWSLVATTFLDRSNFEPPWFLMAYIKVLSKLVNIFENLWNPSTGTGWNLRSKIKNFWKVCIKCEQVSTASSRIRTQLASLRDQRLSHFSHPGTCFSRRKIEFLNYKKYNLYPCLDLKNPQNLRPQVCKMAHYKLYFL